MSTIADSDYFLINRGDKSYKITAADVKSELGGGSYDGEGRFDTPVEVLSPVSGAGLTTSATYSPVTLPGLYDARDFDRQYVQMVYPEGDTELPKLVSPVTQTGPDGEVYQAKLGKIESIETADYTSKFKYSGPVIGGVPADMFDGSDSSGFALGPNSEFDFTDCDLPIGFLSARIYVVVSASFPVKFTYTDGTTADVPEPNNASIFYVPVNKALKKINCGAGDPAHFFQIKGFTVNYGSNYTLMPNIINWLKDDYIKIGFESPPADLKYVLWGHYMQPNNELAHHTGHKGTSLYMYNTETAMQVGDELIGPPLIADSGLNGIGLSGNALTISKPYSGIWFPGLCAKGAPITQSAPEASSVEFKSINGYTTPVTGTNVSLTNRRWTLSSASSESGPWTVVGTYDDDSANLSQNGIDKWEDHPVLQPNTYYQVKVRYDSSNAPSEESVLNVFKTA